MGGILTIIIFVNIRIKYISCITAIWQAADGQKNKRDVTIRVFGHFSYGSIRTLVKSDLYLLNIILTKRL